MIAGRALPQARRQVVWDIFDGEIHRHNEWLLFGGRLDPLHVPVNPLPKGADR
jgi:hypothetical protein